MKKKNCPRKLQTSVTRHTKLEKIAFMPVLFEYVPGAQEAHKLTDIAPVYQIQYHSPQKIQLKNLFEKRSSYACERHTALVPIKTTLTSCDEVSISFKGQHTYEYAC
jgi:hypothetical protein